MGAFLRAVPTRKALRGALFRVGTARNTGVSIETSVRRLCPPYKEILSSRFFFSLSSTVSPFSLSSSFFSYSLFAFSFATRSRGGRSADSRSGASGHPRPAKVRGRPGTRRGACLPPRTRVRPSSALYEWPKPDTSDFGWREARLSALHRGDFRLRVRASGSGISSAARAASSSQPGS